MIEFRHISKVYQSTDISTTALDNVSFTINKGEFIAIVGPSGSGKSTLMHILGLLETPTSGSYILHGRDVTSLTDDELAEMRNKMIGFVFQAFHLLPRRSALRNVMLPMHYADIDLQQQEIRAKSLLESVGLGDRLFHTSSQLSGGQKQRVAIARALAMNPSVILADEPTGNLSSTQGEEIMHMFSELNKKGHTVIVITHEQKIASFAKRTITMQDSRLVKDTKQK